MIAACVLCLLTSVAHAQNQSMQAQSAQAPFTHSQFTQTVQDLPLMQGAAEDLSSAVDFDTPTGRIIEFSIAVPSSDAAFAFYAGSLPALGWQALPAPPHSWQRGRDSMTITAETQQKIHISIKPLHATGAAP